MENQQYSPYEFSKAYLTKGYARLPQSQNIEQLDFVIAGISYDNNATYRTGQRSSPDKIRKAFSHDGYHIEHGIDVYKYVKGVDYGDIYNVKGNADVSLTAIQKETSAILSTGVIPICLGGDSAVTFPELLAYKDAYGPISLIHFGAKANLGNGYNSNHLSEENFIQKAIDLGCINTKNSVLVGMRGVSNNKSSFDTDGKYDIPKISSMDIHQNGIKKIAKTIRDIVENTPCMISFDVNFVDPQSTPGCGSPVPFGISSLETIELLRASLVGLNIKGFDFVNMVPDYDSNGITAIFASQVVFEFISLIACKKAGIHEYKGGTVSV